MLLAVILPITTLANILLTINENENDSVDCAHAHSCSTTAHCICDGLATLPICQTVGGISQKVQHARLDSRSHGLLDAILARVGKLLDELLLEALVGAERLDNSDIGQALERDRGRRSDVSGHETRVLAHVVTTHDAHAQEGGQQGDEDAGELGVLDEGDDVGGDEHGHDAQDQADLLRGAGLDDGDVAAEARRDLAGGQLVEEGDLLLQEGAEVLGAQAVGEAVAEQVPGDDVDVDEDELGEGQVEDLEHLVVDGGLVLDRVVGGAAAGRACRRVEVVQQLAEDDADEREGHAGRDAGQGSRDQEADVDDAGLGVAQEAEVRCEVSDELSGRM